MLKLKRRRYPLALVLEKVNGLFEVAVSTSGLGLEGDRLIAAYVALTEMRRNLAKGVPSLDLLGRRSRSSPTTRQGIRFGLREKKRQAHPISVQVENG